MDLDSHGARHLNDALLVVVRPGHVGDVASEKSLEYLAPPSELWRDRVGGRVARKKSNNILT